MTPFRFGYSGPAFGSVDELVDVAVRAERAGFDTLTLPDLPRALSPLLALAAAAQATSRIGLSPFVLNTGLWSPATVARELASLDRISGGRLEIVLGSGIPQPALEGIIPSTRDARFARLQETVNAVRAAFSDPGIGPGFVDRPRLLVAGTSDRTLRLAAEQADGFIIAGVPPVPRVTLPPGQLVLPERDATAQYLKRLRSYVDGGAERLEVGTGAAVVLSDDAAAAAAELAAIHTYLTTEQVRTSPKILIGTADEIAAQILERGSSLGLTYNVLRGASPEELAPILAQVRTAGER